MSELTERAVEVVMQHQRYSAARFILRDIIAILDGAGFLTEPDDDPRPAEPRQNMVCISNPGGQIIAQRDAAWRELETLKHRVDL